MVNLLLAIHLLQVAISIHHFKTEVSQSYQIGKEVKANIEGDKEVILHPGSNRRRERSRSRDEDNEQYDDEYNYPPQRGGHFQRGMYPPMPMMYGKYYQQYPMMGYMEPRR